MPTNVERSDEANTAAALTSATPIISAAAVADVRRGARPAFSRARMPGAPSTLATGQPMALVTGLATVDETLATPRNSSSAPPPARASNPSVPPGRRNSPVPNMAAPSTVTIVPTTRRRALSASNPSSGRMAATGGTLAARRAGTMTASIVMPTPTTKAISTVQRLEHRVARREAGAGGVEQVDHAPGHEDAAADADHRGDQRHDQRLDVDHPADLRPRRADGPQQGELPQALTDRDLEHVVDEEGADERRDEGEDQQTGPEGVDEHADVGLALGDQHVAGDDLRAGRQDLLDPALHGGDVLTLGDGDVDAIEGVTGAEHLGGRRDVPGGQRGAGEAVAVAEADEGRDRELVGARVGDHVDRVADDEVLAIGRGLVDGHLVGALRRRARRP